MTTVLSKKQFSAALAGEIERGLRDEQTVLVVHVVYQPIPGQAESGLRSNEIHPELIDRIRSCNEHVRATAPSSGEIMLYVPSLRRRSDGEEAVGLLLGALTPPITVDELPHHLSPLIGAALLDHENPSVELLVDGAKLALDECDSVHRAMLFHPYQRVRNQRRQELEVDLRAAVINRSLTSALQPAFDLETGELVAFEAFARWERQGKGPVPAIEFVHTAHEIGVGHLLGRQVLEQAFASLDAWASENALAREVTLWLNVSPEEILHPEFNRTLAAATNANEGIRIGLELSPSPPSDARDIHQALKMLAAQGVRIAVGDFGIGNANLTVLQRLPFDAVKLDRALIRQIAGNQEAGELVKALIDVAGLLGLETTAQGVEDEAQARLLGDYGCKIGQGYYYAEPAADLQALRPHFQSPS